MSERDARGADRAPGGPAFAVQRSEQEAIAATVLGIDDVAAMSSGPVGQFRSYLPGGSSVPGVRVEGDRVDVNVVAVFGPGLPQLGPRVAAALAPLLRGRTVIVHVDDVLLPGETSPDRADSLVDGPATPAVPPRVESDH